MKRRLLTMLVLGLTALAATLGLAAADFVLTDGTRYSGRLTSANDDGILVGLDGGGFSPRVAWARVSQETLKELMTDPKVRPFAADFYDAPIPTRRPRQAVVNLKEPSRSDHYTPKPKMLAAFTTPVGLLILLCIMGASIYAGYEVAVYKDHPAAIVCGASAIIPIIGPVIFLFIPSMRMAHPPQEYAEVEPEAEQPAAAPVNQTGEVGVPSGGGLSVARHVGKTSEAAGPETKIYKKPDVMFNRRFFETQLTGFFRIVPTDAEKDLIVAVRCGRTEYLAKRISRITMNDLHMQLLSGGEQSISFTDISEVQVRHKDAKA